MKKCTRCLLTFDSWFLWKDHVERDGCLKVIRPERTTDRTKAQIVADAERTWLAKAIVDGKPKATKGIEGSHYGNFVKKLARELAASKGAKHDGKAGAAGRADGDELQAGAGADEAGVPWQG